MQINLLTFCRKYGYETIFPIDTISVFLRAYEDGTINMNGLKCCIEAWLEEIVAVGVIDGKPAVYVKKD